MGRAPVRLLRAARVPGGRRPEPRRLHPPVSALRAPGCRPADQGARPGGQRGVLRARRAGAGRARLAARGRPRGHHRAAAPRCWSRPSACSRRSARRSSAPPTWRSASSAPRRRWSSRSRGEIEEALEHPVDYKSVLQERLARRAEVVTYLTVAEDGPGARPQLHRGRRGRGAGARPRGGKDEEGSGAGSRPARSGPSGRGGLLDASALDIDEGLQVLPRPDQARVRHGRVRRRRAERVGQVEHHRRRAVGARRAVPAGGARAGDEGRDLRRRSRRAGLEVRRGRGGDRQHRRPPVHRLLRHLDRAPAQPRRRGRVPPQRRPLPARRRDRGALRLRARQGDALGRLAGQGRADRACRARASGAC